MRLTCPHCSKSLEYSGEPPNFCGFCGRALRPVSASSLAVAEAPTVPPSPKPPHSESRVDLLADASTWIPASSGAAEVPGELTRTFQPAPAVGADDPAVVGNYRLLRRLGGGGMGTVYEAEDLRSGQRVALKLISRDFARHPEALKRFRQEGRLASQLSHPRCVFVLAVSEEEGRPYIVMELMTGQTLAEVVARRGPLPVVEAVSMIVDVIDGLMEAHRLGLVHRDVKPSNCFVESSGRVKIGDFGLAKSLLPQTTREQAALTKTGSFLGTPLYAAPEQIKGEKVDQQVDVYAVAATLYFLLTGKAPFEGSNDPLAVMARIVADDPPPPRQFREELPAELEEVIMRGLERDRKKRWATMAELRRALTPFLPRRRAYVGLGLRLVAYLIDMTLLIVVGAVLGAALGWLGELPWVAIPRYGTRAFDLLFFAVGLIVQVGYFTIAERHWGASLGKWLVRLRVHQLTTALPPTWGQAFCRSAVFTLCFAAEVPLLFLLQDVDVAAAKSPERLQLELRLRDTSRSGISLAALAFGTGLVSVTMRRRNNLRGIHEFASGTQVVRLPGNWFARPTPLPVKSAQWDVTHPAGMPATIDRFLILGALQWEEDQQLLTASDPTLERTVWIWRRRVECGELNAARRSLSRATRWRWLAGGVAEEGWCWDAFLSRPGVPVTQLVSQLGRRPWREVRPILRQLADELAAACVDDTVPSRLGADQVWLDEQGQVYLLDMPLGTGLLGESPAPQARAVTLLCQTATLLLEGSLSPERKHPLERPRAPLPLHDEKRLAHLFAARQSADSFSVPAWAESFHEGDEAPLELSRTWRVLIELGTGVVLMFELAVLAALIVPLLQKLPGDSILGVNKAEAAEAIVVLACLVVNVVLSFLTRGGLRLGLFRVALRTTWGQRPSRWRAVWRTLLAGLPFVVLLLIRAGIAGVIGPSGLNWVMRAAELTVLASYVVLPLLWPHRTWYDYLSSIKVVPK